MTEGWLGIPMVEDAKATARGALAEAAGTPGVPSGGESVGGGSVVRLIGRTFLENKLAVVGVAAVASMAAFCFIGPLLYHSDTLATRLLEVNLRPGSGHPLGTDDSGRDILGRLMVGGQSSLEIGFAVAIIAVTFGSVWGALAGFLGGFVDAAMMRVVDGFIAIPGLFLFLFLASIIHATLWLIIVVLSAFSWLVPARLARGETLSLRTREFVQAVKVMGGTNRRIVVRHLLPNTLGTIIVNATFQVADAILVLAVLSYLGFGLAPPAATWGGMLSAGIDFIYDGYWWQIYPAGVLIVLTVVSFNVIGDALRDAFEVRLQVR